MHPAPFATTDVSVQDTVTVYTESEARSDGQVDTQKAHTDSRVDSHTVNTHS